MYVVFKRLRKKSYPFINSTIYRSPCNLNGNFLAIYLDLFPETYQKYDVIVLSEGDVVYEAGMLEEVLYLIQKYPEAAQSNRCKGHPE